MTRVEEIHRPPSRWQAVAVFVLSTGFAIGATNVLASHADSAGWCCVHTWAMAHGTGLIVLLLFGLLGFHLVRAVGRRLGLITRSARSSWSWLPHVAYASGALGTLFFTEHFMWLGLVAGLAAVWLRVKGRAVQPFGLAIIGLLVSVLCVVSWLSIVYRFRF
jgi:hypothetical protein